MKKFLIVAGVMALVSTVPAIAKDTIPADVPQKVVCERKAPDMFRPDMGKRPHFNHKKFEDELKLTDKQKEQVTELRKAQMETAKPLFEKLRQNEEESRAIRKQLHELRLQNKKDFEAILTDKQLKKLEAMKVERKQELQKHHRDMRCGRPLPPPPCRCNCGCKPPVEIKPE